MADHPPTTEHDDEGRWLTRRAACEYLSCSEPYLDQRIKDGRLPSYKIGTRAVRLRLADVQAILQPVEHRDPA